MAIPVTIVGGYLGAGKVSLINHVLTSDHGLRVAVLVNDFGAVNIDASLIAGRSEDTISLANGCVCCAIQDDFGDALNAQTQRASPPDHIIVEASGVAEPARIVTYASALPGVRLDAVVTLVDVETVRRRANDKFVGTLVRRQLAAADFLVLNRLDLVSADAASVVSAWLSTHAPTARQVAARQAEVDAALLFGATVRAAVRNASAPAWGGQLSTPFFSVSIELPRHVDLEALKAALTQLPHSIHRIKGFVTDLKTGQSMLLQCVGNRHALTPARPDEQALARDVLVLIGTVEADVATACDLLLTIVAG